MTSQSKERDTVVSKLRSIPMFTDLSSEDLETLAGMVNLRQLPKGDARTRAILEKMSEDEARHGQHALQAGGKELPAPIRSLMNFTSKLMTRTAYWL